MKIKLEKKTRNKMRADLVEVNGFTLDETKKWSDKILVENYKWSLNHSLFLDSQKKEFPKQYKPLEQQKAYLMATVLKQAGLSVA